MQKHAKAFRNIVNGLDHLGGDKLLPCSLWGPWGLVSPVGRTHIVPVSMGQPVPGRALRGGGRGGTRSPCLAQGQQVAGSDLAPHPSQFRCWGTQELCKQECPGCPLCPPRCAPQKVTSNQRHIVGNEMQIDSKTMRLSCKPFDRGQCLKVSLIASLAICIALPREIFFLNLNFFFPRGHLKVMTALAVAS